MADLVASSRLNEADTPDRRQRASGRRGIVGWLGMPVFLVVLCGATYLWIQNRELDTIEARTLTYDLLSRRLVEHLQIVAVSTIIVVLIAIPLGIVLTRPFARRAVPVALAIANAGQAIPSLGLITILVFSLGVGFDSVIIGLVAYSVLPILRNTMVGLEQVDPTLIKASRGMGMSKVKILFSVELPLAIPVMIAGIRTALIINVGTATLATFFAAGGLGTVIFTGIGLQRAPVIYTGVVMVATLALLVSYLADTAGYLLSPKGLSGR